MIKVFCFGVMPPPIGGVSVHVKRLYGYVNSNELDIEFKVFDYQKRKLFHEGKVSGLLYACFSFFSAKIVHVHVSSAMKILLIFISKIFLKKVVYTHHNSLVGDRLLFWLTCALSDKVLLVNSSDIYYKIRGLNWTDKFSEIPAFIPPDELIGIPIDICECLAGHSYIFSTNCYSSGLIDGEEIYGIKRLCKIFKKLAEEGRIFDSVLVICDPSGAYENFFNIFLSERLSGNNSFVHINREVDYASIIKESFCTIRPTITDGDAISVRESLYYGVPVIASDCVKRPAGATVYRTLDDADLETKILSVIARRTESRDVPPNYAGEIVDIYKRLGKN